MIALGHFRTLAYRSHLVTGWRILFLQCLFEEDRLARRENRYVTVSESSRKRSESNQDREKRREEHVPFENIAGPKDSTKAFQLLGSLLWYVIRQQKSTFGGSCTYERPSLKWPLQK